MEDLPVSNGFDQRRIIIVASLAVLLIFAAYFFLFSAPLDFPQGAILSIDPGVNLHTLSSKLKEAHIIRSRNTFEAFVITYGGEHHLRPGDYLFESRLPVFEVARRISFGDRHLAPIKITIPEGFTTSDIQNTFSVKLPHFDKEKFAALIKDREGYLFPDTYFLFVTDDGSEGIKMMENNYQKKISPIRPEIKASGKSEKDIITMASIIEKEAKGPDREFISGILWHRLDIGMPIQVDAAPETYKSKGLPRNPISNPGLEAIMAAIHPKSSNYIYYLHDKNQNIHYAKTFTEHRSNTIKYLK